MDFSRRSYQKEFLDRNDIPFDAIEANMHELNLINTWLGGHRITICGFKYLIRNRKKITICEIGCGGGDNLVALQHWCNQKNIEIHCTGIDINPHCIAIARSRFEGMPSRFIESDYRLVRFEDGKTDIVFSSLFCHHFDETELVSMLKWMQSHSEIGFFINDLHRHFLAFHAIRLLTRLFSKSWLVKNDAPLSVLRGFTKKEWESLLKKAGIPYLIIRWKWAFRWLIVFSVIKSNAA